MVVRILLLSFVAITTAATPLQLSQLVSTMVNYVSIHEVIAFLSQFDSRGAGWGRRELNSISPSSQLLRRQLNSITPPSQLAGDAVKPEAYNGWIDNDPNVEWRDFTSAFSRRGDAAPVKISYVTARNATGQRGGVIISVGHTEPVEKYSEQIHDLLSQGFSPVYALDHRGQGRSTRLLPDDSFKSHVESSANFINDFAEFVTLADAEMTSRNEGAGKRFMHCHSMGCAIGLTYLMEQHYSQKPTIFNAVAANAPLIKPVTDPFPYDVAVAIGNLMLVFGLHTSYPPTKGKTFEELYNNVDDTTRTDRQRIQTARCLALQGKTYPAGHTGLCLGDVTALFASEFFGMFDAFQSFKDVKAKLSTPILLQQARDNGDGSDGIVVNTEQTSFCSHAAQMCTLKQFPQSEHNIWFEKDSIRTPALQDVYKFYDAHAASVVPQNSLPPTCYWRTWCRIFGCDCIHECSHPAARC